MRCYFGIDNGVSGAIAILKSNGEKYFFQTPVINVQDYTKTKKNINRLNCNEFYRILKIGLENEKDVKVLLERPMINPMRWTASISAARCLEAELICLETMKISYSFLDSKCWQSQLLPKGIEKEQLKKASMDIGIRTFPEFKELIIKQKDADALLMAEYGRLNNL